MLKVNGYENEFVVDLNDSADGYVHLDVESYNGSKALSWGLAYVSDGSISASCHPLNGLDIKVELERLKVDGKVFLRNHYNEVVAITLKPNNEAIREKDFTFKFGKYTLDGKTATFTIVSKENGKHEPWEVREKKMAFSYITKPTKTKLTMELAAILPSETTSVIWLLQPRSGNEIAMEVKHAKDGTFLSCEEKKG